MGHPRGMIAKMGFESALAHRSFGAEAASR